MKHLTLNLALAAVACSAMSTHAAPWPQWRGENRDGISKETNLSTEWPDDGPPKLWEASVGTGVSSFAVRDGKVYTLGNQKNEDHVYCFDAASGKELWRFSYPCKMDARQFEGGPAATPVLDGDTVFTLSHEGLLHALDAGSGKSKWSVHLEKELGGKRPRWGYSGSPLVVGDTLYVEAGVGSGLLKKKGGATLFALKTSDGSVVWKSGEHAAGYAAPVLFKASADPIILSFNGHGLSGFALDGGKELWSVRWETDYDVNSATPLISGKEVFISSGYGSGSALFDLSGSKPKEIWRSTDYQNQFSTSVLLNGFLYGFHGGHVSNRSGLQFRCVEWATGKVQWEQGDLGMGTVILVGDTLLIQSEGGELIAAEPNPQEFKELRRAQILGGRNWVSPAFSDGRLFCKNNEGKTVAFDLN